MRRVALNLIILAFACGVVAVLPVPSDAQGDAEISAQRRAQRPLTPRSHGRRQADRAGPRTYVPGHFAWDARRGQYSWVAGRWENYDPTHAFVGAGWHLRNGQWTFGPVR